MVEVIQNMFRFFSTPLFLTFTDTQTHEWFLDCIILASTGWATLKT